MLEFPGRRRKVPDKYGPVTRQNSIEGEIYQIGGKDETINVHLRNRQGEVRAEVSVELAKKLAHYLLAGRVRLFGQGDWYRNGSRWEPANFTAFGFEQIRGSTVAEDLQYIGEVFAEVDPDEHMKALAELRGE